MLIFKYAIFNEIYFNVFLCTELNSEANVVGKILIFKYEIFNEICFGVFFYTAWNTLKYNVIEPINC